MEAGEVIKVKEELISSDIVANHSKPETAKIASRKPINQTIPDLMIREMHRQIDQHQQGLVRSKKQPDQVIDSFRKPDQVIRQEKSDVTSVSGLLPKAVEVRGSRCSVDEVGEVM